MKKWMIPLIIITAISLVSAQGLGELLDVVNESTLILAAVFIISFSILFFALNKFLGSGRRDARGNPIGNPAIAGAISVALAILITYGVNKMNLSINIQDWFSNIGISSEALMTIVPLLVLGAAVFFTIKFGAKALVILGALIVVLGLFAYEQASNVVIIGVAVAVVGIVITAILGRKKGQRKN